MRCFGSWPDQLVEVILSQFKDQIAKAHARTMIGHEQIKRFVQYDERVRQFKTAQFMSEAGVTAKLATEEYPVAFWGRLDCAERADRTGRTSQAQIGVDEKRVQAYGLLRAFFQAFATLRACIALKREAGMRNKGKIGDVRLSAAVGA